MKAEIHINSGDMEVKFVEIGLGNIGGKGDDGKDGKSAYEIYLESTKDEPKLSEEEWSATFKHNLRIYKSVEERDADSSTKDGMLCTVLAPEVFDLASKFDTGTKILAIKIDTSLVPPFKAPEQDIIINLSADGNPTYTNLLCTVLLSTDGKLYISNKKGTNVLFDGTNWNASTVANFEKFYTYFGTTSQEISDNTELLNWFTIKGKKSDTTYRKRDGKWIEFPDLSKLEKAIAAIANSGLKWVKVDSLPETGETNKVYLVPNGETAGDNIYDEYMWFGSSFEKIGDTTMDLSGYLKKTDLATNKASGAMSAEDKENLDNLNENAVRYTPQTLTSAQAEQARKNLQITEQQILKINQLPEATTVAMPIMPDVVKEITKCENAADLSNFNSKWTVRLWAKDISSAGGYWLFMSSVAGGRTCMLSFVDVEHNKKFIFDILFDRSGAITGANWYYTVLHNQQNYTNVISIADRDKLIAFEGDVTEMLQQDINKTFPNLDVNDEYANIVIDTSDKLNFTNVTLSAATTILEVGGHKLIAEDNGIIGKSLYLDDISHSVYDDIVGWTVANLAAINSGKVTSINHDFDRLLVNISFATTIKGNVWYYHGNKWQTWEELHKVEQPTTLPNIDVKIDHDGNIFVKPDYVVKGMMIGFVKYRRGNWISRKEERRKKRMAVIDADEGFNYDDGTNIVYQNNYQLPPIPFVATEPDGSMKIENGKEKLFLRFFEIQTDRGYVNGFRALRIGIVGGADNYKVDSNKKYWQSVSQKLFICSLLQDTSKPNNHFWIKGNMVPIKLMIKDVVLLDGNTFLKTITIAPTNFINNV